MPRLNRRFAKQETMEVVALYLEAARGWVGEGKIQWAECYYALARARLEMFKERHPEYKRQADNRLAQIVEEQQRMYPTSRGVMTRDASFLTRRGV